MSHTPPAVCIAAKGHTSFGQERGEGGSRVSPEHCLRSPRVHFIPQKGALTTGQEAVSQGSLWGPSAPASYWGPVM